MADVWVALEMQRLRQQSAMLATTPPGSRSSFGSLASLSSSASSGSLAALPITVGAGAVLPPAPPPYASRHRKVVDSSASHLLAPPPGFGSPMPQRRDERCRLPTPPAEGAEGGSHGARGLAGSHVQQLWQLAPPPGGAAPDSGPAVGAGAPVALSVEDDEEESAFDGVTEGQLEKMRLLQVQQQMLIVEQAQLDTLADPCATFDLPPPPEFDAVHSGRVGAEAPRPRLVGGDCSGATLPGYLPAPPAFADCDADFGDTDDDTLAEMFGAI